MGWIALIASLFLGISFADEHYASSLSPADIQRAVNAAVPGDTVVLSAGEYVGFNQTVSIPNGISLRGQGMNQTILRNTSGGATLFSWNSQNKSSSYQVKISGLRLLGAGDASGIGINLSNILDFVISEVHVEDFSVVGIGVRGNSRGVIHDCELINIWRSDNEGSGYGVAVYGDGLWDEPKPPLGTKNAVYVEDCYISKCKHGMESNGGAHYVFRHNKVDGLRHNRQGVDVHGKQPAHPCGGNTYEIYENTIVGSGSTSQTDWGITVRGGDGVIFNNTISKCDPGSPTKAIAVSIDDHGTYPDLYQVRELYLWGNTHDGSAITDIFVASAASPYVKKNREYFMVQKPGYTPYPYPHPLRSTDQSLSASAGGSPASGQAPLTVNFSGRASGGVAPYTYSWNFGDGQSSTSQNPSHTYTIPDSYVATLTAKDSQGAQASDTLTIRATDTADPLSVTASASPTAGLPPLTVSFTGSASGGTSPYTYSWDFGDGGSSTSLNSSHTYTAIGSYTATLTVTDASSDKAVSSVGITVTSTGTFSLMLASKTGAPAPGQGGTTSPSPGTHSYAAGATAWPKALANANYRFSRWSGDISSSYLFSSETAITMNANKSISATFCARCADVTGDLLITPADAQAAFDIFLGKLADPTWCELENGDVNLSGTPLSPSVTPSDAQLIFKRYLRHGVAASDCSGKSRSASALTASPPAPATQLTLNLPTFEPGQDIAVPILLEASSDVAAFGFDLEYPPDKLEFLGLERTDMTSLFTQLEANPLKARRSDADALFVDEEPSPDIDLAPPGVLDYGALRVGGYKLTSTDRAVSGVLVTIIFRVIGDIGEEVPLAITAVYDDLRNATVSNGAIKKQEKRSNEEVPRTNRRKSAAKRYDF
jgi:PKD repeat protein